MLSGSVFIELLLFPIDYDYRTWECNQSHGLQAYCSNNPLPPRQAESITLAHAGTQSSVLSERHEQPEMTGGILSVSW